MDSGVESYDESSDTNLALPIGNVAMNPSHSPESLTTTSATPSTCASSATSTTSKVTEKRIFDLMSQAASLSSIRASSSSSMASSSSPSSSFMLSSKRGRRLRLAAHVNNVSLVKQLLRSGVDVNSCDEQGRSALHLASSKGFVEVVHLLLSHQANPDLKDRLGNTPLHLAVCTNHVDVVTQLLRGGTNVCEVDKQGRTALQLGLQMATSKLRWIRKNKPGPPEMDQVKSEMWQMLELMQTYVSRRASSDLDSCSELLTSFSQRLSLHKTHEELSSDLHSLLQSLNDLQV